MTILVDLDGVLCTEERTFERALAKPLPGAREAMSQLISAGHTVVIYTSRSWSELRMTKQWLDDNGIHYSGIHMGKPVADKVIDDRAITLGNWGTVLAQLGVTEGTYVGGPIDEGLLYLLRKESKTFLEQIANRSDILEPILEVGPMTRVGGLQTPVFSRMPDTFLDSRELFLGKGKHYVAMDIDPASEAEIVGDFSDAESLLESGSFGTVILLSVLEHMPRVWEVPRILDRIMKPGGRAFVLTPWNLRFHGPRPDCWRISDDGYQALFGELFAIEQLQKIECPGRPLSPVGMTCVLRKERVRKLGM
jgi:hypothetical protein